MKLDTSIATIHQKGLRLLLAVFGGPLLVLLTACGGGGGGGGSAALRITSTAPGEAVVLGAYRYQLQSNASGAAVFELVSGPDGMTVDDGGLVQWTPQLSDLGTHAVAVKVSSDNQEAMQSYDLRAHQGLLLGVTFSPRGHTTGSTGQDFIDHYSLSGPWGSVIAFHSPWRDSIAGAGQIPDLARTAMEAARIYGFTPAVGIGWTGGDGTPDLTSESDAATNSWLNVETRNEFIAMVSSFADTYKPPYLFLGNETNSYWLISTQQEWDAWISVFEESYAAIKSVSPDTMVYTVFMYEKMQGLGANAGFSNPNHMDLILDHTAGGMIDAIGFTTYPFLHYDSLAELPANYYDDISNFWTGPVIFTEIGWLSAPSGPYPGGLTDQADFVSTFLDRVAGLDVEYATWLFLHDWDQQATVPSVLGIGLRNNDASVIRPADAAWQGAVSLRQR